MGTLLHPVTQGPSLSPLYHVATLTCGFLDGHGLRRSWVAHQLLNVSTHKWHLILLLTLPSWDLVMGPCLIARSRNHSPSEFPRKKGRPDIGEHQKSYPWELPTWSLDQRKPRIKVSYDSQAMGVVGPKLSASFLIQKHWLSCNVFKQDDLWRPSFRWGATVQEKGCYQVSNMSLHFNHRHLWKNTPILPNPNPSQCNQSWPTN